MRDPIVSTSTDGGYAPTADDRVDVVIHNARYVSQGDAGVVVDLGTPEHPWVLALLTEGPARVTVTPAAPDLWPPRPGELWEVFSPHPPMVSQGTWYAHYTDGEAWEMQEITMIAASGLTRPVAELLEDIRRNGYTARLIAGSRRDRTPATPITEGGPF